jgi:hypothetical protein
MTWELAKLEKGVDRRLMSFELIVSIVSWPFHTVCSNVGYRLTSIGLQEAKSRGRGLGK